MRSIFFPFFCTVIKDEIGFGGHPCNNNETLFVLPKINNMIHKEILRYTSKFVYNFSQARKNPSSIMC